MLKQFLSRSLIKTVNKLFELWTFQIVAAEEQDRRREIRSATRALKNEIKSK